MSDPVTFKRCLVGRVYGARDLIVQQDKETVAERACCLSTRLYTTVYTYHLLTF